MKKIVSLGLAVCAAIAPVAASASNVEIADDGSYRITVSYADLNLASEAGKHMLNTRLKSAARAVCGPEGTISLRENQKAEECSQAILRAAQPQVALALRGQDGGSIAVAASR